jgi:uncharacterized membrane protein
VTDEGPIGKEKPPSPRSTSRGIVDILLSFKPEWVFLALALPFGAAFVAITPPYQVADEEAHFRRSFELSMGRIIPVKQGDFTGDYLPRGIEAPWERLQRMRAHPEEKITVSEIREAADLHFSTTERDFVVFSNTAIHPPLTYLPQALAIFVARQFSSSVLVCLYAGRVLNFLAATALTFLAIRLTPVVKWGFTVLALAPMALYMAASVSSDALTNALSFLLLAQILASAFGPSERLTTGSIATTALLALAVGLAKQAYFLLPLAYLLIPVRKLGTKWRYWAAFGVVLGATLLPVFAWSFVVRSVYSRPDPSYTIDPPEQFQRFFSRGDETLRLLRGTAARTLVYGEEYLGFFGWLDTRLPTWLYFAELALLLAVCSCDFNPRRPTGRQALLAAAIALIVSLSVLFIVHLTWDPLGAPYITLQGRYFIPVGPLIALTLAYAGSLIVPARRAVFALLPVGSVVVIPIVLAFGLLQLHYRYYVDSDLFRAERSFQRGVLKLKDPSSVERAYELFEETIQIDPDHPGANYYLALHLRNSHPREAADHLRASLRRAELRGEPAHIPTLKHLADILAEQGEFPEAIRRYEEALRLRPDDANLQRSLAQAIETQKILATALQGFSQVIADLARSTLIEDRYRGSREEWLHLKPDREYVVEPVGRQRLPLQFYWRSPPPCGPETVSKVNGVRGRAPFYACSAVPYGPKRIFVFPPPVNAVHLADDEVSWFFQLPLKELTADELQKEDAYRKNRGIHFPLATLPD